MNVFRFSFEDSSIKDEETAIERKFLFAQKQKKVYLEKLKCWFPLDKTHKKVLSHFLCCLGPDYFSEMFFFLKSNISQ